MRKIILLFIALSFVVGTASAVMYGGNIAKNMTSNTTCFEGSNCGVATASSWNVNDPLYYAYYVFNRNITNDGNNLWISANGDRVKPWISYRVGDGSASFRKNVGKYILYGGNVAARNPKNWSWQGSNDGVTWVIQDTRFDQTLSTASPAVGNSYEYTPTGSYSYYRLNMTNISDGAFTNLNEIEFFEIVTLAAMNFTMNGYYRNISGANPLGVQFNDTSVWNATITPDAGFWSINGSIEYQESTVAGKFTDAFNISRSFPLGIHQINLTMYNTSTGLISNIYRNITVNQSLEANFNRTPTWANKYLGNSDELINFVDMSTGAGLYAWKWDYGDGNTSTTRSPWYGYNKTGNFNVNLTVWGADGYDSMNWTDCMRINDNSTFVLQVRDDSSYGLITLPITVTLSQLGIDYTSGITSSGTVTFELPDGAYDVLAEDPSGTYSGNIATVTVAGTDVSGIIYLAKVGASSTTYWSPQTTTFHIVDDYGNQIRGAYVVANFNLTTLPSTTTSWLISNYGMNTQAANEALNGTLMMSGYTSDTGDITFTMHPVLTYDMEISYGGTTNRYFISPRNTLYNIRFHTLIAPDSLYSSVFSHGNSQVWFTEPDPGNITFQWSFQDTSGLTQRVDYYLIDAVSRSEIYHYVQMSPGTGAYTLNYTEQNIRGNARTWYINLSRVI